MCGLPKVVRLELKLYTIFKFCQYSLRKNPLHANVNTSMALRHTARRIAFWFFTALFLVIGAYLTIKMLGYVIDTKHFRLTKAAGIYVKFTPRDAALFLDGEKYPGTSGFLSNDIYVPGLAPGNHTVTLSKDGYYEWKKEFTLESGKVASSKDIILWPKKLIPETSTTNVAAFWITKDGPLIKSVNGGLFFAGMNIKGRDVVISNSDSQFVVTRDANTYYFIDLDNASTFVNVVATFNELRHTQLNLSGTTRIREIISHPFIRTTLIVTTNSAIYLLDIKKMEIEKIFATDKLVAYAVSDDSLFAVDAKGVLTATNLILRSKSEYPLHLEFTTRIIAAPDGTNLLITDTEKRAFLYTVNSETLKKVETDVAFLSFSPDSKRAILISGGGEARILYLKDFEENVIRKVGDTSIFTFWQFENSQSFEWMPFAQNYFLIGSGNSVMAEEFDTRGARNIVPLANNIIQSTMRHKTLYLLNSYGVLTSQKLGG